MINNDILRRIRYTFDLKDKQISEILALVDQSIEVDLVKSWLKRDDEVGFKSLNDREFSYFLDSFILYRRGPREGTKASPQKFLSNNDIFRKIKMKTKLEKQRH